MSSRITFINFLSVSIFIVLSNSTKVQAQLNSNKSLTNINSDLNEIRIPFRQGDKWGLSDTSGNITIKPEYDDIINMKYQQVTKQTFYYFIQNKKIILTDQNNIKYLQQYDSINNINRYVYKNGKVGLYEIVYRYSETEKKDTVQVLIEPKYDKMENQFPYYLCHLNGKIDIIKRNDNGIVNKVSFINEDLETTSRNTYNIEPIEQIQQNTTKSEYELQQEIVARRRKTIENITRNATKEDLAKILPIEFTKYNEYIKFKENNKEGIVWFFYSLSTKPASLVKNIVIPAKYDFIEEIGLDAYLVKLNGKYGVVMQGSKDEAIIKVEPIYDEIVYHPNSRYPSLLLKRNGKYAYYSKMNEKIITDFEYDGYLFIPSKLNKYLTYIILEKEQKKTIATTDSFVINEAIYDDIVIDTVQVSYTQNSLGKEIVKYRNEEIIKVKYKNKFGALKSGEQNIINIEVPCEYDNVIRENSDYYTVEKNGLKGAFMKSFLNINIPTKYTSVKEFYFQKFDKNNSILLFEVTDEKGAKFLVNEFGKEYYNP